MRTQLTAIVLAVVPLWLLGCSTRGQVDPPTAGKGSTVDIEMPVSNTEEQIKAWAKETFGKAEHLVFESDPVRLFLVFAKAGWGRPPTAMVYVFAYNPEDGVWQPRIYWASTEPEIKAEIHRETGELVLKSKSGKALMSIHADAFIPVVGD